MVGVFSAGASWDEAEPGGSAPKWWMNIRSPVSVHAVARSPIRSLTDGTSSSAKTTV